LAPGKQKELPKGQTMPELAADIIAEQQLARSGVAYE
jgi:hypothetical protein